MDPFSMMPPPSGTGSGGQYDFQRRMLMDFFRYQAGADSKPHGAGPSMPHQPPQQAKRKDVDMRKIVTALAAQLYGQTSELRESEEKCSLRLSLKNIILKDPDINEAAIGPVREGVSDTLEGERKLPYPLDLPQMQGRFPWKELPKPPPPVSRIPSIHVQERLDQRWKQIVIGLLTPGHQNFLAAFKRGDALAVTPIPPDIYTECSKREFDRKLRHWRRLLHLFDDPDQPTEGIDTSDSDKETEEEEEEDFTAYMDPQPYYSSPEQGDGREAFLPPSTESPSDSEQDINNNKDIIGQAWTLDPAELANFEMQQGGPPLTRSLGK
eukprot:TRINITY_DN4070_c5_g1_i1.p1 TRINITY_DN4070_c5_g1~~TRINITY_DN4070_c5_g1_i1.p1  ORF type:complete len:324 (+),score=81.96 TRINITY_DN4070_c5_g1_i1:43-1014(+)